MNLLKFNRHEDLIGQLSNSIALSLQKAIDQEGKASLVLSGGSTPIPLYQTLANMTIDWAKITLTLSDERWVSSNNKASNFNMINTHLLQNLSPPPGFIPFTAPELPNIVEHVDQLNKTFLDQFGYLSHPYTVTLLGMGNDGHTASLFPCSPDIATDLTAKTPLIITTPQSAPHQRISMTLQEIRRSEHITLLIRGEEKLETLNRALEKRDGLAMPIYHLLKSDATTVYWAP